MHMILLFSVLALSVQAKGVLLHTDVQSACRHWLGVASQLRSDAAPNSAVRLALPSTATAGLGLV